jgi:hypothetical protein
MAVDASISTAIGRGVRLPAIVISVIGPALRRSIVLSEDHEHGLARILARLGSASRKRA